MERRREWKDDKGLGSIKKRGRESVQVGRVVVKGVQLSAHLLHEEASPLGILLSHLLHLHSLGELPTKTQVCL